jgi:AcrR family transcriptional regulator
VPRLTAIRKQALDGVMKGAFFDATVAVLSERGVEGMTMDRVAAAASVAKGSLYHYFRSKKDLLLFVYAKITDPIFHDLNETVAAEQPAVEKLNSHLRQLLDHVAKHAKVFKLLFDDDTAHGLLQSSERNSFETASQRLGDIFRQGIAEGAFRPMDPLLLAHMFLGLCRGVFGGQPHLEHMEQRDSVRHMIMSAFLDGIATKKEQGG